jgi:enterochelin esterase-like enzyme
LIPPTLVVFPNGGMSGYRGDVAKMIVGELIPLIDKNYPTLAKPESRALAGFSMGGSGAIRLTIENPELFAAAASMGGGANAEMETAAEKSVPILKQRHVGFLLINGERDRPTAFENLAAKLNNACIEATVIVHPNLAHNLGLYYELSNERMMKFLGDHLKK